MIAALGGWLTPTRAVGMASFACSAAASGIAWARLAGQSDRWRLPATLTLIHSLLFLDIVFNLRWQLHQLLEDAAMSEHVYQSRRLPQVIALLALGIALVVISLAMVRRQWQRKGALLAMLGTGAGVASWCMEVVSLHAVDRVLYQPKGPFMPVALIWIVVAGMTIAGVISYARGAQAGLA